LIAYKAERVLEVWAGTASGWALAQSYDVRAASGDPGPKLREGDLQVPEGEYRLTALNPNSSYHLSIRVDYPSDQDRAWARRDGRTRLGGDIFVHGKAVSIGCLAIGDDAIEELFLLVADTGLQRSRILIAPNRAFADLSAAHPWFEELYRGLRARVEEVRGAAVK
jgi:murein L,D-transpeptidase YafK